MQSMKIFIVGTGGVGGYLGGFLAKAGNDVTFVARGENYKAIKTRGLELDVVKHGRFLIKPAKVISKIFQIKNPDVVFVTVKTYDTESVAKELSRVVNTDTSIITFQNGIENDYVIKKYIKRGKVYPGLAYIVSVRIQPGVIKQSSGLGKFIFGDRKDNDNKTMKNIEVIMRESGIDAKFSDDIVKDIWTKYVFISAMTGLTALARCTVGTVVGDKLLNSLFERALREGIEVAKKEKVKLQKDIFSSMVNVAKSTNKNAKFSMLVDIERGKKIEIEALNGTMVRLAKKHKLDVPINETIYGALKSYNTGKK